MHLMYHCNQTLSALPCYTSQRHWINFFKQETALSKKYTELPSSKPYFQHSKELYLKGGNSAFVMRCLMLKLIH